MSTDDQNPNDPMDERLRSAGRTWRAAHADAAEIDVAALLTTAAGGSVGAGGEGFLDGDDVVEIGSRPGRAMSPSRRVRWLAAAGTAAALLVAALVLVLVTGPGGGNGSSHPAAAGTAAAGLDGVTWQFVSASPLAGDGRVGAPPTVGAFLSFANGTVTGSDGLNSMYGPVTVRGNHLIFGDDIGWTAVGSTSLDDAPARVVLDAVLSGTVDYRIDHGTLTLTKAGVGTLVYRAGTEPQPVTDPSVLSGTTWYLDTITTGDTSSGSSEYAKVTLTFDNDGGLVSSDGCNTATAPVTASDGTMMIGTLTVTGRRCPYSSTASAVDQVDAVLAGDVTWSITGERLTITKAGVGSLVYLAQQGWTSYGPLPPTATASAVPPVPPVSGSVAPPGTVLSAGGSTSAAPPPPASPGVLAGTRWQLEAVSVNGTGSGSGSGSPGYAKVTLAFAGADRISGTDGCNSFGATVVIGTNTLTISQFLSTTMACAGGPLERSTVDQVLSDGTDTWSITDGRLLLSRGDVVLAYTPAG